MAESPLMTTQEMSRFLRVSQKTIRKWCADGQLPAARIGGVWRIDTSGQLRDFDTSARGARPVKERLR
jgi:excisionase family DNA binding protein